MPTPDQLIARLAERQHSVFSFDQALARGFTPDVVHHRVRSGRWIRVHRGVYAIAGVRLTFESRALASVLRAGSGAAASHTTASGLWKVEGIPTSELHVTVPCRRSITIPGVHVHRPGDIVVRDFVAFLDYAYPEAGLHRVRRLREALHATPMGGGSHPTEPAGRDGLAAVAHHVTTGAGPGGGHQADGLGCLNGTNDGLDIPKGAEQHLRDDLTAAWTA
jgi:hypothetical protein